jgi:hypothetical protein
LEGALAMSQATATTATVASGGQQELLDVSALEPLAADRAYQAKRDTDARVTIARVLVLAYLTLLAAQVLTPFIVLEFASTPDSQVLAAIETMTKPIAAAITSLTGILGFVLGYYFKSAESRSS